MTEQPPVPPGEARRRWREAHGVVGTLPKEAYTSWIRRVGAFVIDQILFFLVAAVLGFIGGLIVGATGWLVALEGIADAIAVLLLLGVLGLELGLPPRHHRLEHRQVGAEVQGGQ